MRQISFRKTEPQILNRTKGVTRRLGWENVKPGEVLCAIRQGQGLRRGEHPVRLAYIRVISVRREPLRAITQDDVRREGFPNWTRHEFITHFCRWNRCTPSKRVTRIEFEYVWRCCECGVWWVYRAEATSTNLLAVGLCTACALAYDEHDDDYEDDWMVRRIPKTSSTPIPNTDL